jgi:hypothetical protein
LIVQMSKKHHLIQHASTRNLKKVVKFHNIFEPMLGWPFGYGPNHCSKSLLMKDFFLSGFVHSFTATYAFFSHYCDTCNLDYNGSTKF